MTEWLPNKPPVEAFPNELLVGAFPNELLLPNVLTVLHSAGLVPNKLLNEEFAIGSLALCDEIEPPNRVFGSLTEETLLLSN